MKLKFKLDEMFIILFITILIYPLVFFSLFGFFLDWRYFKHFNFKDFKYGDYQKSFNEYFQNNIPIYTSIAASKPNIDILTGNPVYSNIRVKDNEIIKDQKKPTVANLHSFCTCVNSFVENVKTPVYCLIISSKEQVNFDDESHKGLIRYFKNVLDSRIFKLDDNILFENSKEINAFYRTGNKLNSMGAYLLYDSNMKKLGQDPFDLQNFNIWHAVDNYYESNYNKGFIKKSLNSDIIEIFKYAGAEKEFNVTEIYNDGKIAKRKTIYDVSKINDPEKTNLIFGGPALIKHVETNFEEGENLLIFADEYINNFMQFLSLHYKKITVLNLKIMNHLNYNNYSNLIKQIKLTDYDKILLLYGVESLNDTQQFLELKYFKK